MSTDNHSYPLFPLPCIEYIMLLWQPQRWQTDLLMEHYKKSLYLIFTELQSYHIECFLLSIPGLQVCFYWDYFLLINSRKTETSKWYLFWSRSSASHAVKTKQRSILFLAPLGQQLLGSHLKKPEIHEHITLITWLLLKNKTTYMVENNSADSAEGATIFV